MIVGKGSFSRTAHLVQTIRPFHFAAVRGISCVSLISRIALRKYAAQPPESDDDERHLLTTPRWTKSRRTGSGGIALAQTVATGSIKKR